MKKFLSLVLALVMTMSLVTVSAGAKDFDDNADITYVEAVDVMSDLKIVDGDKSGNFNPTAGLTRGAAAKIICNLILGPTTAAELNADTDPYPDVAQDSTFGGYIAYCQKEGIISGYADGTFKPANPLTGYAFMKMLLGALGYDADVEGYTGANWSINVAKQAIGIGLNAGLKSDFNGSDFVTREEAMLYAFNTMKATMVDYDTTITVGDVTIAGAQAYDVSNNAANETIKNDNKMQFAEKYFTKLTKKVNVTDDFGRPAITWINNKSEIGTFVDYTTLAAQYTTEVKGGEVYSDIGSAAAKFDDVTYYIDGKVQSASTVDTLMSDVKKGNDDTFGASDNGTLTEIYVDTDAEAIVVVVINTYIADVTADYNAKKETLSVNVPDYATDNGKIFLEDVAGIEGYKYEDVILVQIANDIIVNVIDPEVVENTAITKFSTGSEYLVAGEQYTYAAKMHDYTGKLSYNQDSLEDKTYNIYIDQYGYAIGVKLYSGSDKYMFVVGFDVGTSALSNKLVDANVIFADGTMEVVKLDRYETKDALSSDVLSASDPDHNTWYKYSEDDGVYTLTAVAPAVEMSNTGTYAAPAKINCENVRLYDGTDRAWGNDDSVYITVDVVADATDVGDAITKVTSTYTGIQNIDLNVNKTGKDIDEVTLTNTLATEVIWAVYDTTDNYIIAAVVYGDDGNTSKDFVYALKEAKSEAFSDGYYFWEFEAAVAGKVETLTIKTKYVDVINEVKDAISNATNGWGTEGLLELTYDADGYVINAKDVADNAGAYTNVYNASRDWGQVDVDPDTFDAYQVRYNMANTFNLTCSGRTLYTHNNDFGLTLAEGAPVLVLQPKVGSTGLSIEEYTTVASALDALERTTNFEGTVAAALNDKGTAEYIVISSETPLTAVVRPEDDGIEANEASNIRMTYSAGTYTIKMDIDEYAANSDMKVELYTTSGNLIASSSINGAGSPAQKDIVDYTMTVSHTALGTGAGLYDVVITIGDVVTEARVELV